MHVFIFLSVIKINMASVFPMIPCIRFSFGTNAVYGSKEVSQPEWSRDRKWLCFPCSRCPDVRNKTVLMEKKKVVKMKEHQS